MWLLLFLLCIFLIIYSLITLIIRSLGKFFRYIFNCNIKNTYIDPETTSMALLEIQERANRNTENYLLGRQMELIRERRELDYKRNITNQESIEIIRNIILTNNIPITVENFDKLDHLDTSQIILINNRLIEILSNYHDENLPALVW